MRTLTGIRAWPNAEDPCDSSSSSSSSSSSDDEVCNEVVQWFRLTSANRNVVHILRKGSLDLHPLCRSAPLANVPAVRGVGVTKGHALCQRCITAAPSWVMRAVKRRGIKKFGMPVADYTALRQADLIFTTCNFAPIAGVCVWAQS